MAAALTCRLSVQRRPARALACISTSSYTRYFRSVAKSPDMSASKFNSALLEISNQLGSDQLEKLKFLYRHLGKKALEKVTDGTHLFRLLTERQELAEDNTESLVNALTEVKRPDLAQNLEHFQTHRGTTDVHSTDPETARLHIATDVIAENLGRSWRKLGRKLGLGEVKLESVSQRHPKDLEETTRELLKEWRRARGAEARAEQLIDALRACDQNLTADKVQNRLDEHAKSLE